MKKTMITAAALILLGAVLSLAAFIIIDFDFSRLATEEYIHKSIDITGKIIDINIDVTQSDIRVVPSSDDVCRVEYDTTDKIVYSVNSENGILTVKQTDDRKWYECIGISVREISLTVYLPETQYSELYAKSVSGNVDVSDGFAFEEVTVISTSGDVEFSSDSTLTLTAKTTSGDLELNGISTGGLTAKSTSGDIKLSDIKADTLTVTGTSGDIELENTVATGNATLKTVSGDIELSDCDAEGLEIKSTSGNVEADILTEKNFTVSSSSGDIRVPKSVETAGECTVETVSGDICIKVIG